MRFLADESCDFGVVRALRLAGHDVVAVAETTRRSEDGAVIQLALNSRRILLTEDKDFGHLVFVQGKRCAGVILIRYPSTSRKALAKEMVTLVLRLGDRLMGAFATVLPGRVRLVRAP